MTFFIIKFERIFCISILIMSLYHTGFTQPQIIIKSSIVNASSDKSGMAHVEPFLWVNAEHPEHVIIASVVLTDNGAQCHTLTSIDGGVFWKRNVFDESWVDPWLTSGSDGSIYLSTLKKTENANPVVIYKSIDQGISWQKMAETPISLPDSIGFAKKLGALDRPSFIIDMQGQLKLIAMQGFLTNTNQLVMTPVLYSANKNGDFDNPTRFIPNNLMSNVSNILLHEHGLGFAFMDFGVDKKGTTERLGSNRLWWLNYAKNNQFSIPYYITSMKDAPTLPQSAIDKTNGRIYLTFSERWEDRSSIYLIFSDDNGQTWSDKIIVIEAEGKSFVNPIIAVSKDGVVGISWYDNVLTKEDGCWDVQFAFTKAIQESSFTKPIKISPTTFCTTIEGKLVDGAKRWKHGGDYYGISVDSLGQFHLAWSDTRSGVYQIYYSILIPQ